MISIKTQEFKEEKLSRVRETGNEKVNLLNAILVVLEEIKEKIK